MADPISLLELKEALKKSMNRKSPGGNSIPIELYKHLDDENFEHVLRNSKSILNRPRLQYSRLAQCYPK